MRTPRLALGLLLTALAGGFSGEPRALAGPPPPPSGGPDAAVATAREALDEGRPHRLKSLLPSGSKVHLSLRSIGPARGLHSGGQLIVHLERFFDRCAPKGFRNTSSDGGDGGAPANLHGTLVCRRDGEKVSVNLHLTLVPHGSGGKAWRLSEVWETD